MSLNFGAANFLLLFFLLLGLYASVPTLGDDACTNVFCGQGVCEVGQFIGYNCKCNPGWKKDLGLIILPSCVFPNCTLSLQCGLVTPPPPPPLPPPPPPPPPPPSPPSSPAPFLQIDPCFLVWCGDGTCAKNGDTKHVCDCNAGFTNLLGLPELPCFKQCSFGADCNADLLGSSTPPPPNGTLASPSPNGSDKISKRWSNRLVLLSAVLLAWIMY